MIDYLYEAEQRYDEIRTLRRRLHENAEIGFDVVQTNKIINEELSRIGLVGKSCGRGGIICDIGNNEEDKILLRADIDALSMDEESGVGFSCKSGKMHSCGHDMHASMLLGAASIIKAHESELKRGVTLLFQPAEEILEGAQDCMKHIDTSIYSACYAVHVLCGVDLPRSAIVVPTRQITALGADFFTITLHGESAHGATPHIGANAIDAACGVISNIHGLLDGELPKTKGVIINIGKIIGGDAANAIADKVEIAGNIRYMDYSRRDEIIDRLNYLSKQTALLYDCEAKLKINAGCPPLRISKELSNNFLSYSKLIFKNVFSDVELGSVKDSVGGSEDFANFTDKIPGLLISICAGSTKDGYTYPLHNPKIVFDESALITGMAVYSSVALEK